MLESKEMTRLFRKDSDSTGYDGDSFPGRPEDDLSNEHEDDRDS